MKQISIFIFILTILLQAQVAFSEENIQVAFIRNDDLWLASEGVEKQLTKDERVFKPQWSHDGKLLAYIKDNKQLFVINIHSGEKVKIFDDITCYQWSPKDNTIAFLSNGVLNICKVEHLHDVTFENVALGVGNFSWKPNGSEFIISSEASLLPTGWTSVDIFTVPANANLYQNKVRHLYTLPSESEDFFAVTTSPFQFSNDGEWIAFLGEPTTSISMDMNPLCVLSRDGKQFHHLGNMLSRNDWFQWSPIGNRIAYIEGEGRFVVKNKNLMINEFPTQQALSLTPEGFVERGLTWLDSYNLVVARAKESEWTNELEKIPKPSLYHINMITKQQRKITTPLAGEGDYMPQFLKNANQLVWIRVNKDNHARMYISDKNGENVKLFINDVSSGTLYNNFVNWSDFITIFEK